jgi:thiol-disulfide isomerase/thioredoxin
MVGQQVPPITNEIWLNGGPVQPAELKGKVVLVEFWTFGCYNCRNVEPYVKQWHQQYADQGLVIIGVHSPEFSYEKDVEKVRHYLKDQNIRYLVSIDNDFSTWNRYGNRYWPSVYLIDKRGVIRYVLVGEGGYQETERLIQSLLQEKP